MSEPSPDFLDEALMIAPGSRLDELRRARAEARARTQSSFAALFEPSDFSALSSEERFAAAEAVARVSGAKALEAKYRARRERQADDSARREAILAHAERIGRAPGEGSRADLEALAAAGLTPAGIVTLSQIIAFVAYQARAAVALQLLGGQA